MASLSIERTPALLQVIRDGQAGLTAADDHRFDVFRWSNDIRHRLELLGERPGSRQPDGRASDRAAH